jgi:hypothetical protein
MLAPLRKDLTRSSCWTTTRTFFSLTTSTDWMSTPWATSPVPSSKVRVAPLAGAATVAVAARARPAAATMARPVRVVLDMVVLLVCQPPQGGSSTSLARPSLTP